MADKMDPQELENLASRIANLVAEQLEASLPSPSRRPGGGLGFCGPKFSSCGDYSCIGDNTFSCQAVSFTCTGTFKDRLTITQR
jgi:hypothetical protein